MPESAQLRALRRELLLTRAAAERAQLVADLDALSQRTRGLQTVAAWAGAASQFGARSTRGASGLAGSLVGLVNAGLGAARSHPWLLSAGFTVTARLLRSRTLRIAAVVAVAAGAVWWLQSARHRREAAEVDALERAEAGTDDLVG